jgi:hypothetical protein
MPVRENLGQHQKRGGPTTLFSFRAQLSTKNQGACEISLWAHALWPRELLSIRWICPPFSTSLTIPFLGNESKAEFGTPASRETCTKYRPLQISLSAHALWPRELLQVYALHFYPFSHHPIFRKLIQYPSWNAAPCKLPQWSITSLTVLITRR